MSFSARTLLGSRDCGRRIRPTLLVLAGVAGCVAVFCAGSLWLGRYREPFLRFSRPPDGSEAIAAIPMEYALTSQEYNDVIFLGDSAPLYAIDPIYFETLSGLKGYNLASFRPVSVNGYLLTAQAYLLKHPAPRLIVLCVSPEVPGGRDVERVFAKRFVRAYGREIAGKSPAVDSIVQPIVNGDRFDVVVRRGASIVRDYLEQFERKSPTGVRDELIEGSTKETYNILSHRLHDNRGYMKPTELHGPPNKPEYVGKRWEIRPEWDCAVRALIGLADAAGARLMVRLSPARRDAAVENFEEISRGLRELQKAFPQIRVDPDVQFYDSSLCYDLWHLNIDGAKKFTRVLADDARAVLGERTESAERISADRLSP